MTDDRQAAEPPCKNCGHPIRWTTRGDRPHWTHSGGWQGRRCPGRLTGAEPAEAIGAERDG